MSGMMGLQIGIRALRAQQRALDVTAHNIANANSEGYSRQSAALVATLPYTLPSLYSTAQAGQVGTGVEVKQILRLRDEFVDLRIRDTSSLAGEWQQRSNALREVETILGEPSQEGLRSALDGLWGSLQELHNDPSATSVRSAVRQSAAVLCDVFSSIRLQLSQFQQSINNSFKNKVSEINTTAQRIADLNLTISQVSAKGENPNDLMDERDLLITKLSSLVNIEVSVDARNFANVKIGGFALVSGEEYSELMTVEDPSNNGLAEVRWKATNNAVTVKSGEIAGIYEARDNIAADYINKLDEMARSLIEKFNQVHRDGYGKNNATGIDFFTGTDASTIQVSADIWDEVDGLNNIAAALTPNSEGDGRNALNLGAVLHSQIMNGEQATINDYWGGIIAQLGIDSQRAGRMVDNHNTLKHQLEQQQESVTGVSLDEEMSNMIIYQHAYNAAAKLISTQSEMLDTLVGLLK